MKILVVGSGGREHVLAWKLKSCRGVEKVYCVPGNGGISDTAECLAFPYEDNFFELADFVMSNGIDLTVVGPEVPLSNGITDYFRKWGLRIFGPSKSASEIESSKTFAKNLMKKYRIPTAEFESFNDAAKAKDYVKSLPMPVVVKADGLAAGKGVIICPDVASAENALDDILVKNEFGTAGSRVVIEEYLEGEEASILVFCDGENAVPMVSSQDHKRIYDNDEGPNTGGMGAYSPAPVVNEEVQRIVREEIINKTVSAMAEEGRKFTGVLYCGIMIKDNIPKVLEFNARFGDPETQVVIPRLKTDLVDIMNSCIDGKLGDVKIEWKEESAVCVVMASGGYPGKYEKGKIITGIEKAEEDKNVVVFHAGTSMKDGGLLTSGGRVLGVTALGKGLKESIANAYGAVARINFKGAHYRKDIGQKALKHLK